MQYINGFLIDLCIDEFIISSTLVKCHVGFIAMAVEPFGKCTPAFIVIRQTQCMFCVTGRLEAGVTHNIFHAVCLNCCIADHGNARSTVFHLKGVV